MLYNGKSSEQGFKRRQLNHPSDGSLEGPEGPYVGPALLRVVMPEAEAREEGMSGDLCDAMEAALQLGYDG
jgi:hypothetical protein